MSERKAGPGEFNCYCGDVHPLSMLGKVAHPRPNEEVLERNSLIAQLQLLDRRGGLGYLAHQAIQQAAIALAAETARADERQRAYDDAVAVANAEKARRIEAEQQVEKVRQYAEDRSIHHRGRKNSVVSSWRIASDLIAIVGENSDDPATEKPADEWCREEGCEFRHWRSGDMPTHKRGERCPDPATRQDDAK